MVFVGVASGLAATLLPRILLVLPLLAVVAFATAPVIKTFIGPIPPGTLRNRWDGEICLQSTPSTCGAASTATILKHFGVSATESEVAKEAHSYTGGTEAWYLARVARARGLNVSFLFTPEFTPEAGFPAVVGVRFGPIGHFISILGQDRGKYIVGDPLRGREAMSREELEQRYDFTGFYMRIEHKTR